jgi:thiol-disulfide isomerase/thioredoxin
MSKRALVLVSVIIGLFLVGGGVLAYTKNQQDKKEQDKMAMEQSEAMMKKDDADAMAKEGDTMSKQGAYVTLADYNADTAKYADTKKVYFFHASWCPICQGIEKEIKADMSQIPAGVTLIKTDFDTSTALRQKYEVTTQYTFVQVDNNGNEVARWSATSLADAIAGIK